MCTREATMKVLIVIACFVVATMSVKEKAVTLCGRQLANTRALLCFGRNAIDQKISKRIQPEIILEMLGNKDMSDGGWWSRGRRGLDGGWERRRRSGLVDECCLKSCTTDVILNYC